MFVSSKIWEETAAATDKDDVPSALAFNHDGSRLVVSTGCRVLLYSCSDGKLIKQLKGHKGNVHSISCSYDGKAIASGGADKSTIIWNKEGKGILKFTHSESIQVVAYSPVEDLLISCSSSDFGFWSPQDRSVIKYKVDSKILCASWRNDGLIIALGFYSGKISLYNVHGEEIGTINRRAPVWSLSWNRYLSSDPTNDVLAVGSWDMTLSFYDDFCRQLSEDQYLDYYPSSVTFYGNSSDYVVVGGSSGNFCLLSREGIRLQNFGNSSRSNWIWDAKGFSEKQLIASVDSSGLVSCYFIDSDNPVKHQWKKVLAYRESGTCIAIHYFHHNYNTRIKCNGYIRALALLDDKIAVAVQEQILIYDIYSQCTLKHSIDTKLTIDFIRMTSNHLIASINNVLRVYDSTTGKVIKEWYLDSNITCIENLSTKGEERVLVGCQDGRILAFSIDSSFYASILRLSCQITSIDVSCKSRYIGIICDKSHLYIYDQMTKAYVQDVRGPHSIIFHDEIEYLYCTDSNEMSTIQDIHLQDFSQEVASTSRGKIIKLSGAQIYSIEKDSSLRCDEVNMASLASQEIKSQNFEAAFEIALLGSANEFFGHLAEKALLHFNFSVSDKCYKYLNNLALVEYTRTQELMTPQDCSSPSEVRVNIHAGIAMIENRFSEASESLRTAGLSKELLVLLIKMRKFKEAKELSADSSKDYIVSREAEWEELMKDWERASSLYLECKSYLKAVDVIGEFKGNGWIEAICELTLCIPETEVEALKKCCHHLSREEGMDDTIKSVYMKIKDYSSLIRLYTKNRQWLEIAELYQNHENYIDKTLMIPYADWLAAQGNSNGAIDIYRKVDRHDKSIKLLLSLIDHSILDNDFKETSTLYRIIGREASMVQRDRTNDEFKVYARETEQLSRLFYVYGLVVVTDDFEPWGQPSPEIILNGCTYLLNSFDLAKLPRGLSILKILHQFAKNANILGAYQAARNSYEKIREEVLVPLSLRNDIALQSILVLSAPKEDNPDTVPVCYRCGSSNPLLNKKAAVCQSFGDACRICFHPFIRCFINFDILPLIEFRPKPSISNEEALALIQKYSTVEYNANEFFNEAINLVLSNTELTGYMCVDVDEETLESFNREEVYAIRNPASDEVRFYRNMIPEIGIAVCHECCQFFHEEDYEYEFLRHDGCPLCKGKTDKYGHV